MKLTLPRYKQNLKVDNNFIYSYNTKVAEINHLHKWVSVEKYYSPTISRHINYVAREYGYKVIKIYYQAMNKRGY